MQVATEEEFLITRKKMCDNGMSLRHGHGGAVRAGARDLGSELDNYNLDPDGANLNKQRRPGG